MVEAQVCSYCGAPVQALVAGRCPHCQTVLDVPQASGVVIDARGNVWRVVVLAAGPKERTLVKALRAGLGWSKDQAMDFVASIGPSQPRLAVEHVTGSVATQVFRELHAAGAEVRLERHEGENWVVAQSSQMIRDFQAEHGMR